MITTPIGDLRIMFPTPNHKGQLTFMIHSIMNCSTFSRTVTIHTYSQMETVSHELCDNPKPIHFALDGSEDWIALSVSISRTNENIASSGKLDINKVMEWSKHEGPRWYNIKKKEKDDYLKIKMSIVFVADK